MISKKVTLFTSSIFLATSLFSFTPIKSFNNTWTNVANAATSTAETSDKKLTVMVYSDADNNLENSLLEDIQEMKNGYVDNPNLNLIVLVDRNTGYSDDSSVFGEDFSDTRMYKIEKNKAVRIDGSDEFPEITKTSDYEANMGDGHTLKKFINSCKSQYPADKYALIISNHGGGAREDKSLEEPKDPKAVCWDETDDNDCLYTAEISDTLTKDQSVDLLAYDACLMGTAEVAYQYRPGNGGFSANVMVASPPVVWGAGYDYEKIFSRLKSGGGNNGKIDSTLGGKEKYFDPSTVTALELGAIMVEAQRDSVNSANIKNQVLSCYDLKKIEAVKNSVDKLSVSLWNENKKADIEYLRGSDKNVRLINYFNQNSKTEWLIYPYFDLYDLCKSINASNNFSDNIKGLAKNVMKNVDDMIVYSYGGSKFKGFTEGKNGLSIFLPDGNKLYKDQYSNTSFPCWKGQRWYNSIDTTTLQPDYLYGKLSWCKDGQSSEINNVGNWFELLDCWFDKTNTKTGGLNGYQW
ncbi:clostripain [Clostridium uliginosum]|uniref:Clostripain n=1 Tax=Clostridium uliginosum TaxID=119641 RepID=A0A1I1S8C7_9CLOT|nr:clostripain [Clostridium uliginosum]SFD42716.1 clostripain [Clostridium uliginosum]